MIWIMITIRDIHNYIDNNINNYIDKYLLMHDIDVRYRKNI